MPPTMRAVAVLCTLMLAPLLFGCGAPALPELEVGPATLLLDNASPIREITITNSGPNHSTLIWQASDDSPLVHLSPTSGEVRAGGPAQTVRVSVDFSTLSQGAVGDARVEITSNGGNASLPLRFLMSSARACAASDSVAPIGEAAAPAAGSFVPGELLLAYRDPSAGLLADGEPDFRQLAADVRGEHGLRLLNSAGPGGFERVATVDPEAAALRLAGDPRVAFAHPNYYVTPLALPSDPCYADQWALQGFGVPEAWRFPSGHRVVVAVIDTGVDVDHEDLRDKVLPGYDLRDRDHDPRPGGPGHASAHGTHVAGIALASGNNGVGIAGVAHGPQIELLPVKIFDDSGRLATTADLADAMLWAAGLRVPGLPLNENPAQVINMSVGAGSARIPALDVAAERARQAGSLLLAAAGNNTSTDGTRGVQSPANAPAVIAVGSVDESLERSSFSDWGETGATVDLMAPGGYGASSCRRVRSTLPWSDYGCMAGTSMAAPFAAGVAALLLSHEPGLTPEQVTDRLLAGTYFDRRTMSRKEYGRGILCADRALSAAVRPSARPCGSP